MERLAAVLTGGRRLASVWLMAAALVVAGCEDGVTPTIGDSDEDDGAAQPARWAPADDADLSAEATSIDVLVNEVGCASGATADDRIAPPEVEYTDDEVIVTLAVVPRPGPQNCPGNPNTEYTLELDEALGDRELRDGAHDPPAEPDLDRNPPGIGGHDDTDGLEREDPGQPVP